jgi:hypothetical protein
MVAWHEVPGNATPKRTRPEGTVLIGDCYARDGSFPQASVRVLRAFGHSHVIAVTFDHTVPPGRFIICRNSRHFVPGYHRFVPPGQDNSGFRQPPRLQILHPRKASGVNATRLGRPRKRGNAPGAATLRSALIVRCSQQIRGANTSDHCANRERA